MEPTTQPMIDLKSFRESPTKMRAFVLIVAAILIGLSWIRTNVATTIATVLLLYITFEYVLANQENVKLTRQQMQRQEQVYVQFGLRSDDDGSNVLVWAANLGVSSFLIAAVHVRTQERPT